MAQLSKLVQSRSTHDTGHFIYSCTKGLAFKTLIQESLFKISLKRFDKTLNIKSQETLNSEMVQLFLTIDELPILTDDMRLKFHRDNQFALGQQRSN